MLSCDSCDYVLSAIKYSKFDIAKKLCQVLFFKDKGKFIYFYGIVNLALNNEALVKTMLLNGDFIDIFNEELKGQPHFPQQLCLDPSEWETSFSNCFKQLRNEIIKPKSNIRTIIEGNI